MSRILASLAALLCLGALVASPAVGQEPLKHTKEPLDKVKENVKTGKAVLLDVREQKEWDAGHLKDARLVPLSKLKTEAGLAEFTRALPKDKIVYTHCRSGKRSLVSGEILKKQGFDVRPLEAGYEQLLDAGFEKAAEKK